MRPSTTQLVSGLGVNATLPIARIEPIMLRPWLAVHREICNITISLYLTAFKACRRSRGMSPIEAIKQILKTTLILTALLANLKSLSPEKANPKDQPQHSYL